MTVLRMTIKWTTVPTAALEWTEGRIMTRIEIAGRDFWRILKACANACDKSNFRSVLRYIELRADGTECIATSLDNFIMQQIKNQKS